MKLWRFELKKILYTHRGLLLLTACLALKLLFLTFVPEQKDDRIRLSQKQYDKYLAQLHGPNSPEKADFILREYADCKAVLAASESMSRKYREGSLDEQDWRTYCQELEQAILHEHAAELFAEKAIQFSTQDAALPPAHYLYEYGWQTVFFLQLWPDVFLLSGILLLTAKCSLAEIGDGMLPVLLAAKHGRERLFWTKLLALLTVCAGAYLLFALAETGIFHRRGFLEDGGAPLYSITLFAQNCGLQLSLNEAYLLCLWERGLSTLLFAAFWYGVSVWIKTSTNVLSLALCALILPLLLPLSDALIFTHAGLLAGSRMLQILGSSGLPPLLPPCIVLLYSAALTSAASARYRKGL